MYFHAIVYTVQYVMYYAMALVIISQLKPFKADGIKILKNQQLEKKNLHRKEKWYNHGKMATGYLTI